MFRLLLRTELNSTSVTALDTCCFATTSAVDVHYALLSGIDREH